MNIDKFRPIPFFFITTDKEEELTYEKAYSSLKKLKEDGFGGFILFNKPPHGFSAEKYLCEEWFSMVRNFLRAAGELSLRVWINDGFNYPPGSVAGKIKEIDGTLSQKRVRLQGGEIVFEDVSWGYPAFELERSSELFIELVYEAYKREVGEYFGNVIEGFFSDADNRRINSGVWNEDSPERDFFPWSDNFAETFEEKYHYDIKPYLADIVSRVSCTEARDYWEHASYLYQQWFRNNYKWMKANGLKYSFHTSDSSPYSAEKCSRSSVFTEGRALDLERNSDFPGTDQELLDINANNTFFRETLYEPEVSWGGGDETIRNERYYDLYGDVRSKQASSTAFLYDKETALCEMFAASNWGATYADLRAIALWQVMQGIGFIVPHAYHYRLWGKTKYFAPPAFCEHSHLDVEIKKFNDTIATYAAICNEGDLIAPVALLDITDELWRGNDISESFLAAAQYLNRSPYGYVISDIKGIERKASKFKVAVNPGISLTESELELFRENGITVISCDELDRLDSIIPLDIKFSGCGTPHFMRRNTDKGELVIVANTENKNGVSGVLSINGKDYEISLDVGELAYFSENECEYRSPTDMSGFKKALEFSSAEISYGDENILPIERWLDEGYRAITKTDGSKRLNFTYAVDSPIQNARLCISIRHMEKFESVTVDGVALSASTQGKIFDDGYVFFDLSAYMTVGKHKIVLSKNGVLEAEDRILLTGGFDLTVKTTEKYYKKSGYQYNMHRYIPRVADIVLSTPSREIDLSSSWTEQGRPFYSGGAVYKFKFELENSINGFIDIPKIGCTCRAYLDGKLLGARLWSPYRFDVSMNAGAHTLEIEVANTLANSMEFYRAPSGIMAPITVYEKEK